MFADPSVCGFELLVSRRTAAVVALDSAIVLGGLATRLPPETHVAVYGLVSVAALTLRLEPMTRRRPESSAIDRIGRRRGPRALVHAELNMYPPGPRALLWCSTR